MAFNYIYRNRVLPKNECCKVCGKFLDKKDYIRTEENNKKVYLCSMECLYSFLKKENLKNMKNI